MSTDLIQTPSDVKTGTADAGKEAAPSMGRSWAIKVERAGNWIGWTIVIALIVAQFVLFRQFAQREVVWSYPPNHDQLHFLDWSYLSAMQLHEITPQSLKLAAGLRNTTPRPPEPGVVDIPMPIGPRGGAQAQPPTELLFTLEGAILFRLFGPGRLTALSLNFFHFALFQCVLVGTLRWLTNRWGVALLGLGLLLSAATPFLGAGGLFDFRMDFSALCLYGVFLCAVIRSGIFTDWRWSIVAGLCGAILFSFRFFTILYLVGSLGLLLVFLFVRRWGMKEAAPRRAAARQLFNAMMACVIIGGLAIPLLVLRFDALKGYYVVGHLTGPEKKVRALAEGITTVGQALAYYPKSLYILHAGPVMVALAGWALAVAAGLLSVRWVLRLRKDYDEGRTTLDLTGTGFFLIAAFLVPLLLLTSDVSKSSVVADILVGPTVLILAFVVSLLAGTFRGTRSVWVIRYGLIAVAIFALWRGGQFAQAQYDRHTFAQSDRVEIEKLLRLYDRMATTSLDMGWPAPATGFDSNWDALNYLSFSVMTYERSRRMLRPQEVLANSIFASPPDEQAAHLQAADLIVLTQMPPPSAGQFEFDFDKQIRELKPRFFDWCRTNCVELEHAHFDYPAHFDATVFIRPAVRVEGEADGWIARGGARVIGLAEVLRQRPEIVLIGPNAADRIPQPPKVAARLGGVGVCPAKVLASLAYDGPNYRLTLNVNPATLPERGRVQIDVVFDSSFSAPGLKGGDGERELVLKLPDSGEVRTPASRLTSNGTLFPSPGTPGEVRVRVFRAGSRLESESRPKQPSPQPARGQSPIPLASPGVPGDGAEAPLQGCGPVRRAA